MVLGSAVRFPATMGDRGPAMRRSWNRTGVLDASTPVQSSFEPSLSSLDASMVERRSFVEVYNDRYRSMVEIARLTAGSNVIAEDLVQDAFADLYRHWERVRSPDAYLRRAVVSRCTSWVRRRSTERRYLDQQRHEHPVSSDPQTVTVVEAVQRLPVKQRTAIVLRYYADWSEADIANALACRPGTVKSLLSRARNTLSEELNDEH